MNALPLPPTLLCEVLAPRADQVAPFAEIARALARDVGQPLRVRFVRRSRASAPAPEPVLTLHLPVALASTQHQVWCLACRLACFCPGARVSVLIQGEHAFAPGPLAAPRIRDSLTA